MSDKEEREYFCKYCSKKFKKMVGSTGDGNSKVSSQVKCPACENFMPTWK